MTYDVIVIGAGPAGCVVSRRLADGGATVALLEAGPGLPLPPMLRTVDAVAAFAEPDRFWPDTEAAFGHPELMVPYRLGRGVGGGSSVNTLVATTGDRSDYDRWSTDFHAAGWSWAELERSYHAVVARQPTTSASLGPLALALEDAAVSMGHRPGPATVAPDAAGVRPASLLVADGQRFSAVDGYLASAPDQLRTLAGHSGARVLTRNGSVSGVELDDGTKLRSGRVVLSAGALHSPWLLARSGLVPSAPLFEVEDHPSFVFTVSLRPAARQDPRRSQPAVSQILRWSSGADTSNCDLMALVMDHVGVGSQGREYGAVIITLTDVDARGRLDCGSAQAPRFRPGWLEAAHDRRRLRAGVRHMAGLLDTSAVGAVAAGVAVDDQGTPLSSVASMSDDQLDAWMVSHPGPVAHAAATCPLGGSIVDEQGRFRGVTGLYVIDGSVLPHLPNANPMLPIMIVGDALAGELQRTMAS